MYDDVNLGDSIPFLYYWCFKTLVLKLLVTNTYFEGHCYFYYYCKTLSFLCIVSILVNIQLEILIFIIIIIIIIIIIYYCCCCCYYYLLELK